MVRLAPRHEGVVNRHTGPKPEASLCSRSWLAPHNRPYSGNVVTRQRTNPYRMGGWAANKERRAAVRCAEHLT